MFYTPTFKTNEELLIAAGFRRCIKASDRGWELVLPWKPEPTRDGCVVFRANQKKPKKPKIVRLHALTHHGFINMHADEEIDKRHVAHSGNELVSKKMQEIKALDRPDVYVQGVEYLCDLLSR